MKKSIGTVVLFLFVSLGPAQAGQLGPAQTLAGRGQVSQEIGAEYSAIDWQTDEAGFADGRVIRSKLYLQVGYRLSPAWEAYLRLGASDFTLESGFAIDASDMEGDFLPYGAIGFRGLLTQGRYFDVGLSGQASYYADQEDEQTGAVAGQAAREKLQWEGHWESMAGLLVQREVGTGLVYAGPLLAYGEADLATSAVIGAQTVSSTAAYEEEGILGAVAGLDFPIGRMGKVSLEGQFKNGFTVGAAFAYLRF